MAKYSLKSIVLSIVFLFRLYSSTSINNLLNCLRIVQCSLIILEKKEPFDNPFLPFHQWFILLLHSFSLHFTYFYSFLLPPFTLSSAVFFLSYSLSLSIAFLSLFSPSFPFTAPFLTTSPCPPPFHLPPPLRQIQL